MQIQIANDDQLTRGWVKNLHLMAGCARHGEAWTMPWAAKIRDYLQGNGSFEEVGWLDTCFKAAAMNPPTPPDGLVMRCAINRRSGIFVSIWRTHACFFGLTNEEAPEGELLFSIQWAELGPFLYGQSARI